MARIRWPPLWIPREVAAIQISDVWWRTWTVLTTSRLGIPRYGKWAGRAMTPAPRVMNDVRMPPDIKFRSRVEVETNATKWCTVDVVRERFLLVALAVGIWRPRRPAVMASVSERSSLSASPVCRASSYSCAALNAAELLNDV
jgi:hypothetical protein